MKSNPMIGEMLKTYRKQNQLTVGDVSARLKSDYDMDIAEKTIYGWESNQAHPTADTFVAICELYNIRDLSPIFPNHPETSDIVLTEEEKYIVSGFRKYTAYQAAVRLLLHVPQKKGPNR